MPTFFLWHLVHELGFDELDRALQSSSRELWKAGIDLCPLDHHLEEIFFVQQQEEWCICEYGLG